MAAFTWIAGENDDAARARAFYLLKKYTSATLIQRSIDLYRKFHYEIAKEIRSWANRKERTSSHVDSLKYLRGYENSMENIESLLTTPAHRADVFRIVWETSDSVDEHLWGTRYQSYTHTDPDSFFYRFGYRTEKSDSTGIFEAAALSITLMFLVGRTAASPEGIKNAVSYLDDTDNSHKVMCWTYDSIFLDTLSRNLVPSIVFPDNLPPCPPRNEKTEGQIRTGQKIPITGIWEPWAIDPHDSRVGPRCPNYYLAGNTASEYQFEGEKGKKDVFWRLIWEDDRYHDGKIPDEEKEYFTTPRPVPAGGGIPVRVGTPCPESGRWFCVLYRYYEMVCAGDTMPEPDPAKESHNIMRRLIRAVIGPTKPGQTHSDVWYLFAKERKQNVRPLS